MIMLNIFDEALNGHVPPNGWNGGGYTNCSWNASGDFFGVAPGQLLFQFAKVGVTCQGWDW